MLNMPRVHRTSRALLCVIALTLFAVPIFGQGTAIEPCQPAPTPAKPGITNAPAKVATGWSLKVVDASIPNDPDLDKLLAPYSAKVRELSKVIGTLEGQLDKKGVGGGSLGDLVTDGMRAQVKARFGKPVVLALMNAGGLRKNEIAAGELRASDIFELLPFENGLVTLDLSGAQLTKLLQIAMRDAQSGARVQFKWNDQNHPEFLSGKLIDESGHEQEIDPQKTYTIVTIDFLLQLGGGPYAMLHEAKNITPLNVILRDAIIDYVKSETAAGRPIRAVRDDRYVQVGPGPKAQTPR
ncbi:MAG TPA: 5'-nucleotidase C-terminal domain-containing protein [Pyrinomonadaceae bacterium]|nr:5'-nucleotidase C-terminal domain-containing protein [Pyrinomonadaceae bacterium]